MELSQFEIDMLWVFYRPAENFEKRKAAVHKLLDLGMVKDEGGFNLRITHEGHTFLDRLEVDHVGSEQEGDPG